MVYIVDIDGTICTQEKNYKDAKPIHKNIEKINKLWDEGNVIIYWTSRGHTSHIDWKELTMNQLLEWGCKYNSLDMNKRSYDFWIDDKALNIDNL